MSQQQQRKGQIAMSGPDEVLDGAENMEITEEAKAQEFSLQKPVSQMSDEEKQSVKQQILTHVKNKVSIGNKNTFELDIDLPQYPEFKGVIKFHRPSLLEEKLIGLKTAQHLGGIIGVDAKTENIAIFLATFSTVVDSAPEWFVPAEMRDYELVEFIFRRYAEWLNTFRRLREKEFTADSETSAK